MRDSLDEAKSPGYNLKLIEGVWTYHPLTFLRLVYSKFFVSEVSFTVQLDSDTLVTEGDVIKFDKIISNTGEGYKASGSNHGKFIPPLNGNLPANHSVTFPLPNIN